MKFFYCLICFLLLSFPAFAAGNKLGTCRLKNTEFCGLWYDTQGFELTVTWDKLTYQDNYSCQTMKESTFEDGRPFTLLKCIQQPDQKGRYTHPTPIGFLFTYFEDDDWRKEQKRGNAQMYMYFRLVSTNPCFADNPEGRKACNMSTLFEPDSWSSRGPINKE
jgi:hypothetical protein